MKLHTLPFERHAHAHEVIIPEEYRMRRRLNEEKADLHIDVWG